MKPLTTLLTFAVTLSCLSSSALADRKSREEEKVRQQRLERQLRDVEYILKHESDGTLSDRQAALKAMISTGIAPDEAYWQAGYIKRGDEWVSVEDRWLSPEQEQRLAAYNEQRATLSDDRDRDHYRLAKWCDRQGFRREARAHLMAILLNHPDLPDLRQMLGYKQVAGRWMNEEEFDEAVEQGRQTSKDLQRWGPTVAMIRDGLHSPVRLNQKKARNQLKRIADVSAVPALERILLPSSAVGAEACVEQLCDIDHRISSLALCRAAMFLPESAENTKQAAIEELKNRPQEDFVPLLLDQLSSPMTTQVRVLTRQSRDIFQVMLQVRGESEKQFVEDVVLNNNLITARILRTRLRGLERREEPFLQAVAGIQNAEMREGFFRTLAENQQASEQRLQAMEEERAQIHEAAEFVLASVTGDVNRQSADDWWKWWNDKNDLSILNKPERIREIRELEDLEQRVIITSSSCFVAGTPVWTDRGPRSIEELRVGDMALTKDVETGELAYRPIIRRTVREANELVTIDFGAEQITATGSHPFWVSGEGWVKARDLKAGQLIHTPTGIVQVDGVRPAGTAEVYNLIVDGFHTYFVGISQAMCHDISMAPPTDAIVPGLLDR